MALDDRDILAIINQELSNSAYISQNMQELRQSLSYYLGAPNGTEVEGRSQVMSTDVADSIEWIMPQIMKSFTQNNELVIFDPLNDGDEKQAELESEFVYNILMKKNNGFVIMHQFIKDALMQRNGVVKVYYEELDSSTTEEYTGLSEDQLRMLSQMPNVEITSAQVSQYDADGMGTMMQQYDVKIKITRKKKNICVDSVPLEEFRVNANHTSVDLSNARFTAHVVHRTKSELREMGVSEELIAEMSEDSQPDSAYRFSLQDENYLTGAVSEDDSEKLLSTSECYIRADLEGDSISKLWKITCAGILNVTHVLDKEEIDESPWIGTTGILMSHKFQGLSIYDRIKQIQDQKTALLRNMLDNIYLTNNQRTGVIQGQVELDDLLVSRPGGIVRMKQQGAIFPIETPQLGDAALNMVNYLDTVRAGRTGVSSEGAASPERIGDRVGSEGVDRLMNAKEELVGLIIRVIAETGIKPLCCKIRKLANQHLDVIEDFKFRGQWVQVNPSTWKERDMCSVRVGTGTGNQQAMQGAVTGILSVQQQIQAVPGQALVNPQKIYNTLDLMCKLSGLHSADRFFIDPSSPEGQQTTQQVAQQSQAQQQQAQQLQLAQLQIEKTMADSAKQTADAAMQRNQLTSQIEQLRLQLKQTENADKAKIASLKQELDQTKLIADTDHRSDELKYKYDQLTLDTATNLTKIEADAKADESALMQKNISQASNNE